MRNRNRRKSNKEISRQASRQRRLQLEPLEDRRLLAVLGDVLYRVNAGGPEVSANPVWQADTGVSPASFLVAGNTAVASTSSTIDLSNASLPSGTPMEIFQSERFDKPGPADMQWDFPVTAGDYEVRLYFAETWSGAFASGVRVFDVAIEGITLLDNYDIFAEAGALAGVVKSFTVTSDATLDIDFGRVSQNPVISGIEIIPYVQEQAGTLTSSPTSIAFGDVVVGSTSTEIVTLTNSGATGAADITIDPTQATLTPSLSSFSYEFSSASPIVLAPGQSTTVAVTYAPTNETVEAATLSILHDGVASPLQVDLSGTGIGETTGSNVLYRINAGGPQLAGMPVWAEDTELNPSPYSNIATGGNSGISTTTDTITLGASVPVGTPMEMFQVQRFDKPGPANMEWDFPVTAGVYEVRLYFAETFSGAFAAGVRQFDIAIEQTIVQPQYDIFADAGALTGVMKSYIVSSDANLDIDFLRVSQNPTVSGIEVIAVPTGALITSDTSVDFGGVVVSDTASVQVTLTNDNVAGGPDITIDPSQATLSGDTAVFAFDFAQTSSIVLAPGETTSVTVSYSPDLIASHAAILSIPHSGAGSPLDIQLSGLGTAATAVAFNKSTLSGTTQLARPTSMQFGPDGRLYIAQQNGLIQVYDVIQAAANDYQVTAAETINLIQTIPNHDDDGTPRPDITNRLVTGILVTGTAENPVIYAGSSDPRIGGGKDGEDTNLDTNSSIISRITWNGTAWEKLDLVRGLPRSDEQHAINGLVLDPNDPTILYATVGGNTNMGAPSNNFAFLPEYVYSAAILRIDLAAIGETTYDLPTLDDEDQPGVDVTDPFGGNNGKNQAILVENGPVQLHAVGLRNPYDVVFDPQGRMYTIDNGPNAGWGGVPIGEGPEGNATNDINEADSFTHGDGLHYVTGPGYYGGHPNPTRSNMNNTFNVSNPQSPTFINNPIESDYQEPGVDDLSLVVYPFSTNGLAVYQTANFGGAMQGDLLAASFDNTIKRIKLNATGDAIEFSQDLFSNVGFRPLDVTAPATGPFAGTIWVVDIATNAVYVFEPSDGSGGTPDDRDGDGYSNDDETANSTDPDNPADVPPDFDGDFTSNLLDDDDDNDSITDWTDLFAIDPNNGATTPIGTFYSWENEGEDLGGLLGMGFTGLMSNGVDDYAALYDPAAVTAGGAAGVFTIDAAGAGTARGATNTQYQGYQFGFNAAAATSPFAVTTRVLAPFGGHTPQAGEEMGLATGTGDQDNYVQIVLSGESGGSIQVVSEFAGQDTLVASTPLALPGPGAVDLWLAIDPVAQTLQASYSIDGGTRTDLGPAIAIPAAWLSGPMAATLMSRDAASVGLPVTWDHLGVVSEGTTGGANAAKVEVYPTGSLNNSSTARDNSFRIYNNSTNGRQIASVLFDLSTTYMPDMLFDPNGTVGDTRGVDMIAQTGVLETGQQSHTFLAPRDGGFAQLQIDFSDFDPAELFTFRTDVDPTSVQGSAPPGPVNAADISGLEISGATITITFDDGSQLAGQLFALDEGADFYKVHSEIVLAENAVPVAPVISLVGVATPAVVGSAAQTIRVNGPVGAAVRLLQTEVALHLDAVPNGGYDIDPYEANKVINVSDEVATIGATGVIDIPVTLTDSLAAGGITYFTAVIEEADGRTGPLSNVVKVALNDLPLGSNTSSNLPPETFGVLLSPSQASQGTIGITATAIDTTDVIVAAEYFVGSIGSPGSGVSLTAADGAFDESEEALTGTIASALVDSLPLGQHPVYVRAQDALGDWSTVATAILTKQLDDNTGTVWFEVASTPTPRYEAQGIGLDGKIYLLGGYDAIGPPTTTLDAHVYDAATDQWSQIASVPELLTHAPTVADGTKLYLGGGYAGDSLGGSSNRVWIYDTVADAWTAGTPLPADRGGGGMARVGRSLHYFGGATRADGSNLAEDQPDHWVLDLGPTDSPSDDATAWVPAADLPNPRNHLGSEAVNGLIYAIGGQFKGNEQTGNQADVHRYDPATDQWTQVADLPLPLGHIIASTAVVGDQIVVISGVTQERTKLDTVFVYDPNTDSWRELTSIPAERQSPVVGLANGKVYVVGGSTDVVHSTVWAADASIFASPSTNDAPLISNVVLSPDSATEGPIAITATATDSVHNIAAAEYFIDVVGAEGTGTPLSPADGSFDGLSEGLTGSISSAAFDGIADGEHTVYVRARDALGAWGQVVSTTFTKLTSSTATVLYRVNAGGPEVAGDPVWTEDTTDAPSIYNNASSVDSNSRANSTDVAIDTSHPSVPVGTPMAIFQSNRADPPNGTELEWDFAVTPGTYEVRLYFAEIWSGAFSPGVRVFDVEIEGAVVLDNYDIFVAAGAGNTGVVESVIVSSDANLDINFLRSGRAPLVSAVEIIGPALAAFTTEAGAVPGDYDLNGSVDQLDYVVWKQAFGQVDDLRADGNGDGMVTLADYAVWRDNLGRSLTPSPQISAIEVLAPSPETFEEEASSSGELTTYYEATLLGSSVGLVESAASDTSDLVETSESEGASTDMALLLLLEESSEEEADESTYEIDAEQSEESTASDEVFAELASVWDF